MMCHQFLHFEAWKHQEKVHLQSCDAQRSRWQKVPMDTTKGREKVHLWGLNGQEEILIDSTNAAEKVRITDKAGQAITMDAVAGQITLTDRAGSNVLLDGTSGNILVRSSAMVLINP